MEIMDLKPEDIRVTAASGKASFKMSRGSFRYRDRKSRKKPAGSDSILMLRDGVRLTISLKDSFPEGSNRFFMTIPVGEDEHFYGAGETFSEFDLKGKRVRIWVAEHQNTARISKKIISQKLFGKKPEKKSSFSKYESYYVQPTFVSSAGYYLHVDTESFAAFDFRIPGEVTIEMWEPAKIEIVKAASFAELSEKLTGKLGRQPEMPEWLYEGAIFAVQGGTDSVQKKIDTLKEHGVRVNGIWSQDWCGCRRTGFGYQVMWNWEWDRELYPGLDEKIKEWKQEGIRFLGYINPFMAIEKELYKYASTHGYCVKDKEGKDYLVTITTFPAAMIDFTNPEAYEWYKGLIKTNLIGLGLGGWMADFGEYLPTDCVLASGEDPEKKHNEWPAIWARMNREALNECGVEKEVFFFTRAGSTKTVRYSTMMWNGDQHVDWSVDDGLPSVIPATLSLAMSGFGLTHSDVGGYTTIMDMTRSRELLMRWAEMNAFSPLMRSHEGNQPSRNVQFDADPELLEHFKKMTDLHVRLKDYLKECVKENAEKGIPVMRPLFYHYPEDKAFTECTEYLLGRDYLVAPVIKEGAAERKVYLPDDTWIHIFTGKEYKGGEWDIPAPIGEPPVFVRKAAENKVLD